MTVDLFAVAQAIADKERELHALRSLLARARQQTQVPDGEFVALRCSLAGSTVAIAATQIREVVQMAELTQLPGAAPWFAGLLTIGEERIAVLDLAATDSGVPRPRDPSEFVVLLNATDSVTGLVVDALLDLVTLDGEKVHRPDPELPFGPHVIGVTSIGGESVLLLSAAALASEPASVGDVP